MTFAISSTNSSTATTAASAELTSSTSATSSLGKDAFLKLLVAQLQHQDPLKPMDDTAYVAQLAQFSSLEQMMSVNTKLDTLATGQNSVTNAGLASLIGKNVTVEGSKVTVDSDRASTPVSFSLGASAASVEVKITNSEGKTVRTLSLGPTNAGLVTANWDHKDDLGATQAAGNYVVSVSARSSSGTSVDVSQQSTGPLQSISYTDNTPTLDLANGVSAAATNLIRVDASSK